MKEVIVFSDLDGTMLDHDTYSFDESKDSIKLLRKKNIPLIFCTSKNRSETEYYRKKTGNKHPFIVENGGAIYIPKKYFGFEFGYDKAVGKYYVIKLGKEYKLLILALKNIKKSVDLTGFNDMTAKELAKDSGLPLKQAKLAKKREYDEAFKLINHKDEKKLLSKIKKHGLNHTKGGRYHHIIGDNSKGKAVKILAKLYKERYKNIYTIGIGDSKNDFEMLDAVDKPYLVQKKDSSYASKKYKKAQGIGPAGWKMAVKEVILSAEQKKG